MLYSTVLVAVIALTLGVTRAKPRTQGCRCEYVNVGEDSMTTINGPVHCEGVGVAGLLDSLPSHITNLTYTVTDFADLDVYFTRFVELECLYIRWSVEPTPVNIREKRVLHRFSNTSVLSGLSKLHTLAINVPTDFIHPELFLSLGNLTVLDLTNISAFTTKSFAEVFHSSHLADKPLHTLKLQRIAGVMSARHGQFMLKELLPLLNQTSVRYLDISYNGALTLYPGLIKYLPNLDTYILGNNEYKYDNDPTELECTIIELYYHQNLRVLDLSDPVNLSKEVSGLTLPGFTCDVNVTCVCRDFNARCSHMIGKTPCRLLPSFSLSDLYDTRCIRGIRIPLYPPKLEELYAENVQVGFSPRATDTNKIRCYYANNLKLLDFSYIRIPSEAKDVSKGLTNVTIYGLEKLEEFIIHDSDWGYYLQNTHFLHSLPKLRVLNAANTVAGIFIANDTKNIIFKESTLLEKLILRSAKVTHIPVNVFNSLHSLVTLDLSRNHLTSVSFNISSMTSLRHINLAHNGIPTLPVTFTKTLDNIAQKHTVSVDLSHNRLQCGCNNSEFVSWVKTTNVTLAGIDRYTCVGQQGIATLLDHIDIQKFSTSCTSSGKLYTTIGVISGLILLIITVAGVIIYYKKNRSKSRHQKSSSYATATDGVEPVKLNCIYDGFVVYADEDRQWVHNKLLTEVETNMGLKLCVHFRDFIPGHNIEDQIVNSVNTSYKTIVVLSENFLNSSWCDFEMQTARNRLFSEGQDVILPIILSKLPENAAINKTLCNILSSTTYLEWSKTTDGQSIFWARLAQALGGVWRQTNDIDMA